MAMSLLLGLVLYTAAPQASPMAVIFIAFLLMAVLFAIPAGFLFSLRRYLGIITISALVILSLPLIQRDRFESLACSSRGRTGVSDLKKLESGQPVRFCGELVFCSVASLAGDSSLQEACLISDVADPNSAVMFYNFTLVDRASDPRAADEQAELSLHNKREGTLVILEGRWEAGLYAACAVPNACTADRLPFGELYADPVIFDRLR
jgi:hypothetical protein